jgi:putative ABC transport system permease protein
MKQLTVVNTPNTHMIQQSKLALQQQVYNTSGATFGGVFSNAWKALWSHRQRSILTMLGIVIGIMAFISVVSLSQGVSASFTDKFGSFGQVMTVNVTGGNTNAVPFVMTTGDIKAIAAQPDVVGISPSIGNKAEVIYSHQTWNTSLMGVSSSYQEIMAPNTVLNQGTWWSATEDHSMRRVAVLGDTVVKNVFPDGNAIGKTIRIDQQLYRVIGTLQAQGNAGEDDVVYVPYTVVYDPLIPNQIQSVSLMVDSTNNLDTVQANIKAVLEQRHHIPSDQKDGFSIVQAIAQLQRNEQFLTTLTVVMEAVATFSLIVGGVGVMNIMLVSVSERTTEIGLRSALGAQPWDICLQFLLEALVLSTIGGVLGLSSGLLIAYAVISLIKFTFILNWLAFILALGISTAIGVGFGLYPAIRASRLDPIVALHSA